MIELERLAKNIEKKENGIYFSKTTSNISYPEEGNKDCFQIEQDSFWFNHRNNVIIQAVKNYSPQNFFFDIGGANGFVAKGLQDAGVKVVLVEPGPVGSMHAKNRNIENVVCSTLEDAEFEKSSMHSVGLFDVLEHIEDDYKLLTDIHNYMKQDGYIYITVPAYNFLWSNEDIDAGHHRRYSLAQMNELLVNCGFDIEYSTYIFSILPLPIFFFRSITSKLGLNKKSSELAKYKKEHSNKKGVLNGIMQKIWNWELRKIKDSKKIGFGGSCFVVGKKVGYKKQMH